MKKVLSILVLSNMLAICTFAGSNYAYTQYSPNYGYDMNMGYENSNLQGYAVYVPAGVTCKGLLSQEISSQSAVAGQNVNLILKEDFIYNEKVIAPEGSVVYGTISSIKKAGYGNRNAKMMIRFTSIVTPYGNTIPINAVIATSDSSGMLKGGTAKDSAIEYVRDTAIGAGAGAALGTAMGALSSGSVGKGAVYGTAIGAGLGMARRIADKGEAIYIPANSIINLYFTQPITYTAQ